MNMVPPSLSSSGILDSISHPSLFSPLLCCVDHERKRRREKEKESSSGAQHNPPYYMTPHGLWARAALRARCRRFFDLSWCSRLLGGTPGRTGRATSTKAREWERENEIPPASSNRMLESRHLVLSSPLKSRKYVPTFFFLHLPLCTDWDHSGR